MVAICETKAAPHLVRWYDDGADWPDPSRRKERAFRRGFVEEARRIVRAWAHPPRPPDVAPDASPVTLGELLARRRCDPFAEEQAARKLRQRVRERYAVYGAGYGPGCGGRKTYHLGYRPGHEVPAARLRGRHHAMAYVIEPWHHLETSDVDIFDPRLLCPWLMAVEQWAGAPIRPDVTVPPPRLLEVAPPDEPDEPPSEPASPPPQGNLTAPAPPPPLRLTRADQITMRPPRWLLRGTLERDTFALIFGDPGCGKSFLAIDWACRVATGTPWRGHDVRAAPVVYLAGEGQNGLGRRISAWQAHHGVSITGAPLFIGPALAIPEPGELMKLIAALDAQPEPPALVVLDTLARCFGGGDENSTQDMSRFVVACDAIRRRFGCTVLVVHHTGHADKHRARGAIALKAALDAEYRLSNFVGLKLSATKMKEAETPPPLGLELVRVELPDMVDDYGNPVTSAAIEVLDADVGAIISKANAVPASQRGQWQRLGLQIAQRLAAEGDDGQVSVDAWREAAKQAGMNRQNRHRVLKALSRCGDIAVAESVLSMVTP